MRPNFAALRKGCWRSRINLMDEKVSSLSEKAFAAYRKKDFTTASEFFTECIRLLDEQQNTLAAAEMRNNLSVVLLELKNAPESLKMVEGTDLVFAAAGDIKRQAMALGNIGTAQQALGLLPEALASFEQSAELFKQTNEKEMRSITLKKIADLQLKTGKQFQAMASLDASYDQSEKKSLKERILQGFLGTLIKKITRRS